MILLDGVILAFLFFTEVKGKLVHRWQNWKYFYAGELYYYNGGLHQAGSNGIISSTPSTTSSYSTLTLSKTGGGSLVVDTNSARVFDGNPAVKKVGSSNDNMSSGYSLYDGDDVKYWRYLGWESQNQRHVTRHQTNAVINTARPVFENVNSMLGHFNGILRYSNGKYELAVKKAAAEPSPVTVDGVSYTVEDITDEDIIGAINVDDRGQKGTYNSVSVSIDDPQNRFESRAVTLFNSTYLKEDRMLPKKGDVKTPYINNYFNARVNAKQYLDDSRAGLKVSFTMAPRGLLLRAGDIIRITYSRFGWSNKLYRIKNLNFRQDCLVQVTADEHNDDGYIIQPDNPVVIKPVDAAGGANMATPAAPSSLSVSQNERGGNVLTWTNTTAFNPATYSVQIWRHTSNNRSSAKVVGISKGDNFTDTITGEGQQTFYYWIRYAVNVPQQRTSGVAPREVFSAYHPTSSTGGGVGISDGARDGMSVNLTNDSVTIRANSSGTPSGFNDSGITITAFIGSTQLNYDDSSPYASPSFRVSNVSSSGVSPGAAGNTSTSYTRANLTGMSADTGSIVYTIIITDSLGLSTSFTKTQTFTKSRDGLVGSNGASGRTVSLSASDQTIEYNTAGAAPSPSTATLTATAFNTSGTVYNEFMEGNTTVQNTTSNTYTYTPEASVSNMPETVTVKIREGGNSGTVVATDAVSMIGLRQGRDAVAIVLTNEAHTLAAANNGTVSSFAGSGTDIQVFQGTTQLTYDDSSPYSNSTFRISASGSSITAGSATTVSNNVTNDTRRFGNASNMTANNATITYSIIVKGSDGVENTFTRLQSFSKSIQGASITGATGPRTANAVLYYQTSSASAPSAPTASNYNFSTGEFGTKTSGWDEDAPTFAAGNANKYWYARITIQEASFGGSQTITVGTVLQGIGFSGLVTFTSATAQLQQISNGSQSLSFGTQGTTTIDGSKITTGQIDAARLNVGQINVTQTNNYSTIQQGIQGAAQQATQAQQGVTTAQQAASGAAQQATQAQQGVASTQQTLTQTQQAIPTNTNQLQNGAGFQTQAFTQPAQINVTQTNNYSAPPTQTSQLQNNSGFQTQAFTQPGQVNVTQTQNYQAPPTQTSQLSNNSGFQTAAIVFSATAISGGKIGLSTAGLVIGSSGHSITASNSIILDTTSGNNAISIYDGSTLRVKIGKL